MATPNKPIADAPKSKPKDVSQVIKYLTNTFNNITKGLERPARGKTGSNRTYQLQTEFAYRLNDISQSPASLQQRAIADCNDFIDQVLQEVNSQK